ncbi:MAG: putative 2-dehydropantoate 2-reductase [Cyanobacteria bacterium P01_A01_bin.45]
MFKTYAIIGTGAVGGFYGAKLQHSGKDVHFLFNKDYEYVIKNGLSIKSVDGNFDLPHINAYNHVEEMPDCDVVVVALKTTQNHLLKKFLPAVLKDEGIVLLLQNGLGIEEEIAQIIKHQTIISGLCFLCSNKVSPGQINHIAYGKILLAQYAQNNFYGITDKMQSIADDFENAGIQIELAPDLNLARWKKLVWNIPYNGLSVILNATTEELMTNPYSYELLKSVMSEVVMGAKSVGCMIPDDFIPGMLDYTSKMKPYRTSMKIDYDTGRTLEVEAIFGNPLRRANSEGVDLPLINCLYQQLKFLNLKNVVLVNRGMIMRKCDDSKGGGALT